MCLLITIAKCHTPGKTGRPTKASQHDCHSQRLLIPSPLIIKLTYIFASRCALLVNINESNDAVSGIKYDCNHHALPNARESALGIQYFPHLIMRPKKQLGAPEVCRNNAQRAQKLFQRGALTPAPWDAKYRFWHCPAPSKYSPIIWWSLPLHKRYFSICPCWEVNSQSIVVVNRFRAIW